VFGTLFNDIEIRRTTEIASGDEIKRFKVPLEYSSKTKWLRRIRTDTTLDGEDVRAQMTLPRLGFEMTSLTYDPQRKNNTITKIKGCDPSDPDALLWSYARVPYDMELTLFVIADIWDDGLQIIEQILAFFAPEFSVSIKGVEGLEDSVDVPFIITSTTVEDAFEGDLATDRRVIIWTITFTAKMFFFGPVNSSEIIRKACVNLREWDGALDAVICVTPDPLDAEPGEPFDVTTTIEECE
jgi:hypothetical protein